MMAIASESVNRDVMWWLCHDCDSYAMMVAVDGLMVARAAIARADSARLRAGAWPWQRHPGRARLELELSLAL